MDTVTQDIVAILESYAPEIAPSALAAMIDSIAPVYRTRRRLFIAISKRPGILTGDDANVPVTVQALTAALSEAGAAAIVVPGCESCGRKMQLPYRAPQGGRHCSRAKEIIERDPVLAVGNGDPSIKTSKENTFADRVGGSIRGRLGSVIAVRRRRLSRMP